MKSAFDLVAQRHEAITKEALLGAALRLIGKGALGIGKKLLGTSAKAGTKLTKTVAKNPMKALTVGWVGSETARGVQMGAGQATRGAAKGRMFRNAATF